MSNSNPITLQNIQDYAKKYFPKEFAKLPSVAGLPWESASPYRTKAQLGLKMAPFRLRSGYVSAQTNRAKQYGLTRVLTVLTTSTNYAVWNKSGYELRALIQYYFMLKGAIPEFEYFWALGSFEWAVKSVANGAPLNDISVDQFGHDAAERLLSVRSTVLYGQQTPATTPNKINQRGQDTVPKEEQKRAAEIHSINRIEEKNQMKQFFKEQSAVQKNVDEFLALTSVEKKAHVARIRQLEAQLSEERVARIDANRTRIALHDRNKLLQGQLDKTCIEIAKEREKLKNEISDTRLSKQRIRAELNRQIESEKKRKEDCASTEAKLQKARAFYTNQKELLEIQVADCTDEKKKAIMKAFEQDYGELGVE
ncbi:uncharacterized protein J4E79_001448 [Alternaria viburni]|uniref:uncharacterized protein n=1 Tax=Alternaria viburni TaxID=566460 RepID=UPI0020C57440|nr:uncharacterized protein J4E79_001448 [Alternaria viburni]KAI4669405.1 hypothetical protein J4E79_001448 [Alternaria viburni]